MKSLKPMSYEWLDAICWSSLLLGIFIIKQFVAFSLIVLGPFEIRLIWKRVKCWVFYLFKTIQ